MDKDKREQLGSAGWTVDDAEDFLNNTGTNLAQSALRLIYKLDELELLEGVSSASLKAVGMCQVKALNGKDIRVSWTTDKGLVALTTGNSEVRLLFDGNDEPATVVQPTAKQLLAYLTQIGIIDAGTEQAKTVQDS